MTLHTIKQAIQAGKHDLLAQEFKLDELQRLIRKLLGDETVDVRTTIELSPFEGKPMLEIETDDLLDRFGTFGALKWMEIFLGSGKSTFSDKGATKLQCDLEWNQRGLDEYLYEEQFATLALNRTEGWSATLLDGETITLD